MKKLSIEEKAKLYDKAIEELRGLLEGIHEEKCDIMEEDIIRIFPELGENEDERIRKALIKYFTFSDNNADYQCCGVHCKDIVSWLEKQDEQEQDPCEHCKDKCLNCYNFPCIDKRTFEQGKTALEAIKEEKVDNQNCVNPANKVEPKFEIEEGKWYICIRDLLDNYANKAFRKGDIYLSTQNGSLIPSNSNVPFEVVCPDTYFKDWTIQDAKDGDVLSYRDGQWIFIYKEKIDNSFCYYALYSTIHQDLTINDAGFTLLGNAITPATKEQRDLLFEKIEKAGYMWDSKNKELQEIKQKSSWSEEDEDNFKHLLNEIVCLGNNRNSANRLYYDRLIKFIEELKNRAQPKEKWCDKDQRMFNRLIAYFEKQVAFTDDDNPRYANWLKSLKNKILPQQNWSKEDELMLKDAIEFIETGWSDRSKSHLVYWLKSLRPQSTWKPSDEQIGVIEAVINNRSFQRRHLDSLYKQLKRLREE